MNRGCLVAVFLTAACGGPGPFEAGMARVRMPAPVGIGTAGFGPFGVDGDPSPFSEIYPATTQVHGHPDFKAFVFSRGDGHEIVVLRADVVGVFQQLRRGLVIEIQERLGKDLDQELLLAATHTHGGPGRVVDAGGPFDFIADRFLPEHYERMIDAMADAVELAYDDLAPARFGEVRTSSAGHADRRCEDGQDFTNDQLSILAIEREGRIDGLILGYAIHGTTVGIEELTLTADVSGAMEDHVEGRFEHPVLVGHVNAWGGDMSPSPPEVPTREDASPVPEFARRQDAVGTTIADAVEASLAEIAWTDEPEIQARTRRVEVNRQVLGYDAQTFPYAYGAAFCGADDEQDCDVSTTVDDLDERCIPFTEDFPAPAQTELSVGVLGNIRWMTFPGECVTPLAERILGVQALENPDTHFWFIGYGQDYLGYALEEEDWWQGGYEASGTLWGPKQGPYLADQIAESWVRFAARKPPAETLDPTPPFNTEGYAPYEPESPVDPGRWLVDAPASLPANGVLDVTVAGLDPWLGTPVAQLETEDAQPVLHGGRPLDSDGYAFSVRLEPIPSYREALRTPNRQFGWRFVMPIRRPIPGVLPDLVGRYRLKVLFPDGSESLSSVFEVQGTE
jgi:hypothetical protein